jgi:exopolysaccharide biosynthesis polyprenyl glycosylphosphotransferase
MIRRYSAGLQAAFVVSDILIAAGLFALVSRLRFGVGWETYWQSTIRAPILVFVLYAAVWVGILALNGLYRPRYHWSIWSEAADIVKATAWMTLGALAFLYAAKLPDVSRLFLLVVFPTQALVTMADRALLRLAVRRFRAAGRNTRYVVIVGARQRGQEFAERLEANPWLGLQVAGFLDDDADAGAALPASRRWLGPLDRFSALLHETVIDEVAVCIPAGTWDQRVVELVHQAEDEGKIVRIPMGLADRTFTRGLLEDLDGMPVYSIVAGPDRLLELAVKRALDIVGALVGLVVLSPIMLGVAVVILARDGRPILFTQERVGLHGRTFRLLKFRTMGPDAEARYPEVAALSDTKGPAFKMADDPRVTPLGRTLRRTSLDELPQLWNVLRGDMSLVGPRPAPLREVDGYDGWHRRRLSMKPGITGLWQVTARFDQHFDDRVSLDLAYIDSWSLLLDLRIMARTVPAVLAGTGR